MGKRKKGSSKELSHIDDSAETVHGRCFTFRKKAPCQLLQHEYLIFLADSKTEVTQNNSPLRFHIQQGCFEVNKSSLC